MNLISATQRGALQAQLASIHDTLSRDVVIFKTAQQILISTSPQHNYIWGDNAPGNDVIQEVPVSGVFRARIQYAVNQDSALMEGALSRQGGDQISAQIEQGTVRLKLDATGIAFIEQAKRIVIDGEPFAPEGSPRPHGLFGPQFYDIKLRRLN